MSRTSRKARAFRPCLSDDLETRVVPSTVTAFQARQAALNTLHAERQAAIQQRNALVQQRQTALAQRRTDLFAQRQARLTSLNTPSAGVSLVQRQAGLSGLNTASTGVNFAQLQARLSGLNAPTTGVNFAGISTGSPFATATATNFANLTSGVAGTQPLFSTTSTPTSVLNLNSSTIASPTTTSLLGTTGTNNTAAGLASGSFGFGFAAPGSTTFTPSATNTTTGTFAANAAAGMFPFSNSSNASTGVVGTGVGGNLGPFAGIPTSTFNGLFGLGNAYANTGAFNFGALYNGYANAGLFGLGPAYANTGAYNFSGLYNNYVNAGIFGLPSSMAATQFFV
jgi:hypothetical protein